MSCVDCGIYRISKKIEKANISSREGPADHAASQKQPSDQIGQTGKDLISPASQNCVPVYAQGILLSASLSSLVNIAFLSKEFEWEFKMGVIAVQACKL